MEFWLSRGFSLPTDFLVAEARLAEEFNFDGFMINEHIVSPPVNTDSIHPYGPRFWDRRSDFPDPWVAFGHLSASTSALKFCTAVCVLACHETFAFARSVATAACLSGNRVMVGAGTGWLKEDYIATGNDFASRDRKTDEMLDTIARLLAGELVDVVGPSGETVALELVPPLPTLAVPLLYGGITDRAIQRAARVDGWIGVQVNPSDLGALIQRLRLARANLGLAGKAFQVITSLTGEPSAQLYREAARLGVTGITVGSGAFGDPTVVPYEQRRERFKAFAANVMAPVRAEAHN